MRFTTEKRDFPCQLNRIKAVKLSSSFYFVDNGRASTFPIGNKFRTYPSRFTIFQKQGKIKMIIILYLFQIKMKALRPNSKRQKRIGEAMKQAERLKSCERRPEVDRLNGR